MSTSPDTLPADFDENPEWTDETAARARPFREVFPDAFASLQRSQGQLGSSQPKKHISLRLAPELVDRIRAGGADYHARVEQILCEALAAGKL